MSRGKPFVAGYDRRRHIFSDEERARGGRLGYLAAKAKAMAHSVQRWAWLYYKIRGHHRAKRRALKGGAA